MIVDRLWCFANPDFCLVLEYAMFLVPQGYVMWRKYCECATNRGHHKLYSKERCIGGLADRLWKVSLVSVTTWHMPCAQYDGIYDLPAESHYFSYLPVERAY